MPPCPPDRAADEAFTRGEAGLGIQIIVLTLIVASQLYVDTWTGIDLDREGIALSSIRLGGTLIKNMSCTQHRYFR